MGLAFAFAPVELLACERGTLGSLAKGFRGETPGTERGKVGLPFRGGSLGSCGKIKLVSLEWGASRPDDESSLRKSVTRCIFYVTSTTAKVVVPLSARHRIYSGTRRRIYSGTRSNRLFFRTSDFCRSYVARIHLVEP